MKIYPEIKRLPMMNGLFVNIEEGQRKSVRGHVEHQEEPLQAAYRELYEETGAKEFVLSLVTSYSYSADGGCLVYAQLYYAEIYDLGDLPPYEIEEIYLVNSLDFDWTYPEVQNF